jgi:hypothetical protein
MDAISEEGLKGTFSGTLTYCSGVSMGVTAGIFNLPDKLVNP